MLEVTCTDKDGNIVDNLTQWDVDQYILLTGTGLSEAPKIHFCNTNSKEALVVDSSIEDDKVVAKIPNILLQEGFLILAYLYVYAPEISTVSAKTQATIRIPVRPRPKPSNYPYIENVDYISAIQLEERVKKEIDSLSSEYDQAIDKIEADYVAAKSNLEAAVIDYENLSKELADDYSETASNLEAIYTDTEKKLEDSYNQTIDSLISKFADGSPRGIFVAESELEGKNEGIYLNSTDGYVYYWNGTSLSETGYKYQAVPLIDSGLTWGDLKNGNSV